MLIYCVKLDQALYSGMLRCAHEQKARGGVVDRRSQQNTLWGGDF